MNKAFVYGILFFLYWLLASVKLFSFMADERAVLKPVNGFFDGVYQLLLIPGYYLGAFFGQKGSVEFAIVGQIITLLILALIVYLIYSAQKLKNKDDSLLYKSRICKRIMRVVIFLHVKT